MSEFFQEPPTWGNPFAEDELLRSFLRRILPANVHLAVEGDLRRFGQRVATEVVPWAADAIRNEPTFTPYGPWGHRIDQIDVSPGWLALERFSAEEGLVATGYEREFGTWSRMIQFTKLYLFHPHCAVYTCPLAMADGAARALEVHADETLKAHALARLTSRNPDRFWTSGQWMTERSGGSDVSGTETIARRDGDDFRLHGTKWFTSATTSQMAMTLARIVDEQGRSAEGSRGLSMFYLETRDASGQLNGIRVHRLKDKLGTRSVPTAELTLDGTRAQLIGAPGRGVANIASLINITRLYNANGCAGSMRRALVLARDYAHRRNAFGRPLAQQPLHLETLAEMEVEARAAFHIVFYALELLGREECGEASADQKAVLRLLTPLAKLYTGKRCVAMISESLEAFGGAGYVEDTGLPMMLRDAQVTPIWEGTTNVLSLDVLRALDRDEAFGPWRDDLRRRLESIRQSDLVPWAERSLEAIEQIEEYLPRAIAEGTEVLQEGAREFAYAMARVSCAALMLEHAEWSQTTEDDRRASIAAARWCARGLASLIEPDASRLDESRALALGRPLAATAAAR